MSGVRIPPSLPQKSLLTSVFTVSKGFFRARPKLLRIAQNGLVWPHLDSSCAQYVHNFQTAVLTHLFHRVKRWLPLSSAGAATLPLSRPKLVPSSPEPRFSSDSSSERSMYVFDMFMPNFGFCFHAHKLTYAAVTITVGVGHGALLRRVSNDLFHGIELFRAVACNA